MIFLNKAKKLTLSDSESSASLSTRSYMEMRLFVCQLSPLSEAAIADAAILLGEYMEKSCSVMKRE